MSMPSLPIKKKIQYNLKLTDEERLVLKDELESLVRVGEMMQRTVIGNNELAEALNRADKVLVDVMRKVQKL